jgi:hypothetical protein
MKPHGKNILSIWYNSNKVYKSVLDKTSFSCEQDYKETEQRVQELAVIKNRPEKLIANMVNREGYSKLMQIVKENVNLF